MSPACFKLFRKRIGKKLNGKEKEEEEKYRKKKRKKKKAGDWGVKRWDKTGKRNEAWIIDNGRHG